MIHYIKGMLIMKLEDRVVIETGGVGFEVFVPGNSRLYMTTEGEEVETYTYMQVKQDDITLFGFGDERSLSLFKKLIRVNSVGAKAALSILSAMPLEDLKRAIVFEDIDMITRANGVGKKTAQKIVLELKDKLDDIQGGFPGDNLPGNEIVEGDNRSVAIDGLINLGYSKSEAMAALVGVRDEDLTVEEYIKLALKKM
jgi:Holliday junction DNA helicase RuvA